MDDFSREFCNWDKLREQRNKIKSEIDKVFLKNHTLLKLFLEYTDKIDASDDEKKLAALIEVYCYLCDIEYKLTQIRLSNIQIKINDID